MLKSGEESVFVTAVRWKELDMCEDDWYDLGGGSSARHAVLT